MYICVYIYIHIIIYDTLSFVALSRMRPLVPDNVYQPTQQTSSAVTHSRTCLLCDTTEMCAVSNNRNHCCARKQACLLRDTADAPAVRHSRHACCVT